MTNQRRIALSPGPQTVSYRAPSRTLASDRRWPVLAASLALHVLGATVILAGDELFRRHPDANAPVFATVELVTQDIASYGGKQAPPGAEVAAPTPPAAAPPPAQTPAPDAPGAAPPPISADAAPVPPQAEPAPAADAALIAQPSHETPAEAPQTRLGEIDAYGGARATNVIPAGPDSTVHNDPPVYPRLAGRYGESGTVRLMVLVAPDGSARDVQITQTSGYERLDHAARDAVAKWHFRPGQQDGLPVESYYPVNVQFELGDK